MSSARGWLFCIPSYGIGKVVALGGSGGERTATIDFASAAGTEKAAASRDDAASR